MVVYIEACESGSMFQGILANNINVYAVTAANPSESSWGTYCPPDDMVNGVHINSCLGDLFSVNWMEDTDKANPSTETLATQFTTVQKLTAQSHVMEYGQMTFTNTPIGDFEGDLDVMSKRGGFEELFLQAKLESDKQSKVAHDPKKHMSAVSSRDAKLAHLYAKAMNQPSHKHTLALQEEITYRMKVDHIFEEFTGRKLVGADSYAKETPLPRNFDCLKHLVNTYQASCGKLEDYSLQYVKHFVAACEHLSVPAAIDSVVHKLKKACQN